MAKNFSSSEARLWKMELKTRNCIIPKKGGEKDLEKKVMWT